MPTERNRQQGAIAIMVGLTLVVLVGMLALVVDLGHDYLVKTGLQNGADAAALAGSKSLNGTAAGVAAAAQKAIEVARQNEYAFGNPVGSGDSDAGLDMSVGSCPECTMLPVASVTTDALAAGMTFFKVDTRERSMATWFAGVLSVSRLKTSAVAVAGHYVIDLSPIAICQLPDDATNPNVTELGYERGVSYRVSDANPIGPGTMFWIDPMATTAGMCTGNTNDTLPYVCTGKIGFTPNIGGTVYTNTGISDPQLEALDSRFDVFNNKNKCDPATAPPDSNIREYRYSASGNGSPSRWMNPDPARQSLAFTSSGIYRPKPWTSRSFADYGVLWTANRPAVANADTDDAAVSARWSSLYHAGAAAATSYPQSSPHAQTSGEFFLSPGHAAQAGRRVLNMAILDCKTAGGICRPATVLGIGKFFMQRRANIPGDKDVYVEFGGLLQAPFPPAENRLYR